MPELHRQFGTVDKRFGSDPELTARACDMALLSPPTHVRLKFYGYFGLSFLDFKIWKKLDEKLSSRSCRDQPFPEDSVALVGGTLDKASPKCIPYPSHNIFVCVANRNLKIMWSGYSVGICERRALLDNNTSLAIEKACKILEVFLCHTKTILRDMVRTCN